MANELVTITTSRLKRNSTEIKQCSIDKKDCFFAGENVVPNFIKLVENSLLVVTLVDGYFAGEYNGLLEDSSTNFSDVMECHYRNRTILYFHASSHDEIDLKYIYAPDGYYSLPNYTMSLLDEPNRAIIFAMMSRFIGNKTVYLNTNKGGITHRFRATQEELLQKYSDRTNTTIETYYKEKNEYNKEAVFLEFGMSVSNEVLIAEILRLIGSFGTKIEIVLFNKEPLWMAPGWVGLYENLLRNKEAQIKEYLEGKIGLKMQFLFIKKEDYFNIINKNL